MPPKKTIMLPVRAKLTIMLPVRAELYMNLMLINAANFKYIISALISALFQLYS